MSLVTEVQARYSATRLKQLTNAGAPAGTGSIDSTVLAQAATSAEAQFKTYVQIAYDSTNVQHIDCACECVIALLNLWAEMPSQTQWDAWVDRAKALALVTGRDRVTPTTRSTIDPSDRDSGETPDADRIRFEDIVPKPPG